MDVIFSVFKWFVNAIGDIVNLITSIPRYITMFVGIVNDFIPAPLRVVFLLCISAYVIIHIKRLVF